jgi:hypothetical protein
MPGSAKPNQLDLTVSCAGPNPWLRLILTDLEHAAGRLDLGPAHLKSPTAIDGVHPGGQVRTGLTAGGSRIRTSGPSINQARRC